MLMDRGRAFPRHLSYQTRPDYNISMFSRPRLVTLDAFGTLYKPRGSVAKQYVDVAARNGVQVSMDEISTGFKKAYKEMDRKFPNYGKHCSMTPKDWWFKVLIETFLPRKLDSVTLTDLYEHFHTKHAFTVFPDAVDFLEQVSQTEKGSLPLAVITNSDPAVTTVIHSLGLDKYINNSRIFVSYTTGFSKPDKQAFDYVRSMSGVLDLDPSAVWHIGDDLQKDLVGAINAGCNGVYIDREKNLEQLRAVAISVETSLDHPRRIVEIDNMLVVREDDNKRTKPVNVYTNSMAHLMRLFRL